MANRVGQQLGNYRLIRLLGSGAFAEVYLGQHIYLGTQAAIKVLLAQLTNQDKQKFADEARTIAGLIHPNIVRVLDFGIDGQTPYLVMDYAPNGTLRNRHAPGVQLPLNIIIAYVKQIADALQYAHDAKLIHRDVKPENLLVGQRNEILLSDFGIAVVAHRTQTQVHQDTLGTIPYMAPEQIRGYPYPASDQYALGIIVYEWLSCAPPFDGPTHEIIAKHVQMPPPSLRAKVPTLPPLVEYVVFKALEKDPAKRFARMQAFATALEQASGSYTALTVSAQAPVTLAVTPDAPVPPTIVVSPPVGTPASPAVSIFRGHTDYVHSVAWSPDRKRIASGGADSCVKIWEATTGNELASFKHPGYVVNAVVWSPDGKYVASGGADGTIQVWDVDGGQPFLQSENYGYAVNAVAWSPDGRYLAAGISGGSSTAMLQDIRSSRYGHFLDKFPVATSLAWSPDGTYFVLGGTDGKVHAGEFSYSISSNIIYAQLKGYFKYIEHEEWINAVVWSSDSRRIASASEDKTVHVWNVEEPTKTIIAYKGHTDIVRTVAWSPDKRRIASGSDDRTVRVWDATSGNDILVYTGHTDIVRSVAWSPDKRLIASASEDKTVHVWNAP